MELPEENKAELVRMGDTLKKGINLELELIRKAAFQRAEAALASLRPVSIPPKVEPGDSSCDYDLVQCMDALKEPLTLQNLAPEEMEKAFRLVCNAVKAGLDTAEGTPWGRKSPSFRELTQNLMGVTTAYSSIQAMQRAMIRSGLNAVVFNGHHMSAALLPVELGCAILSIAIDLAANETAYLEVSLGVSAFELHWFSAMRAEKKGKKLSSGLITDPCTGAKFCQNGHSLTPSEGLPIARQSYAVLKVSKVSAKPYGNYHSFLFLCQKSSLMLSRQSSGTLKKI